MVTELLWFLRGDTNIKFLVDNNCHIWDGDAYKKYLNKNMFLPDPKWLKETEDDEYDLLDKEEFVDKIKTDDEFANKWGELGPVYGKQWRSWNGNGSPLTKDYEGNVSSYLVKPIDQIANLINDLKTNPDSRRLMVNAWNVGELDQMTLPPCHYGFQVYTRELSWEERFEYSHNVRGLYYLNRTREQIEEDLNYENIPTRAISLMYNARSQDVPLGTPFNISSYALLLEIIGKIVNMIPDELIANMGDCHIYLNQIDGIKEQLTREPYELPTLDIHPGMLDYDLDKLPIGLFTLKNYQSHPSIKMPLSN
jgi:thymidylate synthase